jgi:outer membrane protein assembly factor BamB
LWRHELPAEGIGGVAATDEFVVASSREANDKADLFEVLDAETGLSLFKLSYPSEIELDYGNSPRVTPVIYNGCAYCLGAQGQLHCLDLETGVVLWKQHLVDDLGGKMPQWGYAVSPVFVDDQLIVQPGGLESSWVALTPKTGSVLWRAKGRQAAYASPIVIEYRGQKQIVCYDAISLGGWSSSDGKRLWEMKPEIPKDFNVPSPVFVKNKIFLVTENNGARVFSMVAGHADEPMSLKLESSSELLGGDAHSPVRVGNWIVGVDRDLVVLDPLDELKEVARFSDKALQKHCSLIVDEDRVWVCTGNGTQILLRIDSVGISELGRFQAMEKSGEILSYPAFCNGVLYLRGPSWLDAYSVGGDTDD